MKKLGVYIHIPFCVKKCNYCDFVSFAGQADLNESYHAALIDEIKQYKEELDISEIDSIFIGGGTPTVLPPAFICEIINTLKNKNLSSDVEITIEANPGTVDYEYLKALKSYGINRLSFGLQSCDDRLLQAIGRIHNFAEFEQNYNQAVKLGYKNINVDLMFSLPEQSLENWEKTLDTTCGLSPSSINTYALTLEENTPFGRANRIGKLTLPDDNLDRQMYYLAKQKLSEHGYRHIEISCFVKPGYESRHNMKYWKCEEYLGFGLNAHSYYEGLRYRNTTSLDKYISTGGNRNEIIRDKTEIKTEDAMAEYMFMGLRLTRGVSKRDFDSKFNVSVYDIYEVQIRKLIKQGLLRDESGMIFLTGTGLDLANMAMQEFV